MSYRGRTMLMVALVGLLAGHMLNAMKGAVFGGDTSGCGSGFVAGNSFQQIPSEIKDSYDLRYDVVMGLARYPGAGSSREIKVFVDTLRGAGYVGRIVLFVHPELAGNATVVQKVQAFREYLLNNDVELIGVETLPCVFGFKTDEKAMDIRKSCPTNYPTLPLEYARFAQARDWLKENKETGWALITDVRDTYFQRPPFADLGAPTGSKAYIYEEFWGVEGETRITQAGKKRGIDTSHWFARMAGNCYGKESLASWVGKPMLCSGQIVANREGGIKMLTEYVAEMDANLKKGAGCVTPELPDQPLMNHMMYKGMLTAEAVPFGSGLVMTLGGQCTEGPKRALLDQTTFDADGYILDRLSRRAPVIHQYDRCA